MSDWENVRTIVIVCIAASRTRGDSSQLYPHQNLDPLVQFKAPTTGPIPLVRGLMLEGCIKHAICIQGCLDNTDFMECTQNYHFRNIY